MIGQTIAQYQIRDKLGEGGMGVVYRAWDTRLHRFVALKFLPERVASDPDALERLRQEARAASGLNHPNICTVYDLVETGGRWFIVLEMLEGQTLLESIATGKRQIPEIIEWALQLSDALDVAHSRGIIHRDLKPANVFVTNQGFVKVLDFGLAKKNWRLQQIAISATMTGDGVITSPGSTVGTMAYMSPEQARGLELDARTDIFSAGAVIYELICRRRAFTGQTSALTFNAILNETPVPPSELNRDCPPELERIVLKMLEKDRDVRYQSAAELRADLKRLQRANAPTIAKPASNKKMLFAVGIFAAMLLAVTAVLAFKFLSRSSGPASPAEWVPLTQYSDSAVQPAISRDGRLLAFLRTPDTFMGAGQLYVKVLPDGEPVALTHDETTKMAPSFSPDGSLVSYSICCMPVWDTWVVPVFGGSPRRLFANAAAMTWIDSDHILFSEIKTGVHMGLVTSTAERAQERDVYLPEHERAMVHFSAISPDHKWVLAVEMGGDGSWLPCQLLAFDGKSPARQVGPDAPCSAIAWSPDGRWMYFTAQTGDRTHIWRQRFPDGTPQQVTAGANEEHGIAFSPDGKYFVTSVGSVDSSVWVHDRTGDHQISSEQLSFAPQFGPDSAKIYYLVRRTDGHGTALNELWSSDLQGHAQAVLPGVAIDSPAFVDAFAISPDGTRVVYTHATADAKGVQHRRLWMARMDNGAPPQEFKSDADESAPAFTNDGTIYFRATEAGKNYLYRMHMDGTGREQVLPNSIIDFVSISRDGAWVSVGEERGPNHAAAGVIHPLREHRAPIVVCGMCTPIFSSDGKDIYTPPPGTTAETLYAVSMTTLLAKASEFPDGFDIARLPGTRLVQKNIGGIAPSPDPAVYGFTRTRTRRNLYKIPVR
jgi:serine/threonine protein kinase/Tol biopolymer transport system component